MRRTIIIDCDPGLDDAVAIALAVATPALELAAITTVAGNAEIERVTANALAVVEVLKLKTPVHQGCARPLVMPVPRTSALLWGGDGDLGLGEAGAPSREHAVVRLIHHLEECKAGGATLVAIGPLTNMAVLLTMRPDLAPRIGELVVMGGGFSGGNASAHAELNIWVDPHAAHTVFASGVPIVLAPLDITRPLKVPPAVVAELAKSKARTAGLVARLLPLAGIESHPSSIFDAATIAWLLWPDIFKAKRGSVTVDLEGSARLGETRFKPGPRGLHRVLTAIHQRRFFERFIQALTQGH
jgi:purine nucleosidase